MMQTITISEVKARKEYYKRMLLKGLFIYPTDTIYGVGCDAYNGCLIDKVRDLKQQYDRPFSVIAPSKDWIRKHCII